METAGDRDRPAVRLLFDAGISGKQAEMRLAERGRDIRNVDAALISHDHADHVRCMGIYQRKFGIPLHVTEATYAAATGKYGLGRIDDVRLFRAGQTLRFGPVSVETIPTPHDGVDGVAFVVDDGRHRLGVLTDLGHVFGGLPELIGSLDAVMLESNYDRQMLATGPYPEFLKARIAGPGGHISNVEAAQLLRQAANGRMKWAALAHLSEQNNDPVLAVETHRRILGDEFNLYVAGRYAATGELRV